MKKDNKFTTKTQTPDKAVSEAVARATLKNDNIRIAVDDPSIAGKIKTDIRDHNEKIYWYIKFNIVLDPSTISKKTTNVMETDGYILDTVISYDTEKNLIVINPVDNYEEDTFYILNITRKVRSAGGNHLKRDIHILFKLKDNYISEYKILDPSVKVAKPVKKPKSMKTSSKVYSFDMKKYDGLPKDMLPYDNMRFNIFLALIGLGLTIGGIVPDIIPLVIIGAVICVIGFIHISAQLANKGKRSVLIYNLGVKSFNSGKYKKAEKRFKKALLLNENNEMAEYAVNKSKFYI